MAREELRKKIDTVDTSIVRLIAERIKLAEHIGKLKREQGQQIEDSQREKTILKHIRDLAKAKNINQADIENIYHQIFTAAKSIQGAIVAFQGELGAYSEEAAVNFFGAGVQVKSYEKLEDVFRAVEQDKVQFGIAPIENSLEGSISKTYLEKSPRVRSQKECETRKHVKVGVAYRLIVVHSRFWLQSFCHWHLPSQQPWKTALPLFRDRAGI